MAYLQQLGPTLEDLRGRGFRIRTTFIDGPDRPRATTPRLEMETGERSEAHAAIDRCFDPDDPGLAFLQYRRHAANATKRLVDEVFSDDNGNGGSGG